jgi:hypothetical protein
MTWRLRRTCCTTMRLQRGKLMIDAKKGDAEVGLIARQNHPRGGQHPSRLGVVGGRYPQRAHEAH